MDSGESSGSSEWERRASSFGPVAADYARFRPAYRADAVAWCVAPLGRALDTLRILDLGAGTGKLTELLTTLGADVTAVEPDGRMLGELQRGLPSARALPGSAEAIPLPGASVDAVLCGQSLHWFDLTRALPEIARVLVAGGTLGALWNDDDDRVPWVARLHEAEADAASPSRSSRQGRLGAYEPAAFAAVQPVPPLFGVPERTEFANSQRLTADALTDQLGTHSHVLVMEPARRERLLAQVRVYLAGQPETAAGAFELPMVTTAIRARRLG